MISTLQLNAASSAALIVLMGCAVWFDMREHRIPNWLVLAVLATGFVGQLTTNAWMGLVHASLGALVGTAFFIPFYVKRAMGAGDVKLMGAVGSSFGALGALLAGGFTLAAGFVLAMAALAWRATETHRLAFCAGIGWMPVTRGPGPGLLVEKNGSLRVPYAAAIAVGATAAMWQLGHLSALTGFIK
jgi:prepilin peptidase CpaA